MLHVFTYLAVHDQSKLVMDPTYIDHGEEPHTEWRPFNPDGKNELPPDAPKPLGKGVQITALVGSDHASDLFTRQSRTQMLISRRELHSYGIVRNKQCQDIDFGSEFMALNVGIELVRGLQYKLHMMGVLID